MHKILIVEDQTRIAGLLEKGLRSNGFLTTIASNGQQALQAFQCDTYDIVLLDLQLPILDGWTVLKRLRHEGHDCPVIVISASGKEFRQEVLAAGANDVVPKPLRFQTLLTAVHKQIELQFHAKLCAKVCVC